MPAKILIVDDQLINLKMLMVMLKDQGYDMITANDGKSALNAVSENAPDLILLDVMMPGMDGYEVAKILKSNSETANIPIIFISALTDMEDKLKAFESGAVDFMNKPFNVRELLVRVKTQVALNEQRQEIDRLLAKERETVAELEGQIERRKVMEAELRDLWSALEQANLRLSNQNQSLADLVEARTEQLNRLNQRMSAILASVADSIVLLDSEGKIQMTNRGFEAQFGYEPDELFMQDVAVLVADDHAQRLKSLLPLSLVSQQTTQMTMVIKNGGTFEADVSVSRVAMNSDEAQFVLTCHDISYLKQLESLKDNFISMVTHELRTPITAIDLIANQLRDYHDRMNDDMRQRKLNQLIDQTTVMVELIESVLDISRLEGNKARRKSFIPVDMIQVVMPVLEEQQAFASTKSQRLHLEVDDKTPLLLGDISDLGRLWRNLINNAVKYTGERGKIDVRLGFVDFSSAKQHVSACLFGVPYDVVRLWSGKRFIVGQVRDNGHGIALEQQSKLFTRFYRGWAKESNIPGTGLGLSLVQELLTVYDGHIHVQSELGQGSLFTFWLPILGEERTHDNSTHGGR